VDVQPAAKASTASEERRLTNLPDTDAPTLFISCNRRIIAVLYRVQSDLFMARRFGLYQRQNKKSIGHNKDSANFQALADAKGTIAGDAG
jgi:hypothetical protein